MNKKIIIIAIVAIIAVFIFSQKRSAGQSLSEEEAGEQRRKQAAAEFSDKIGDSISAPNVSGVDEEYNLARQKAIALGLQPRASWTLSQIEDAIANEEARIKALDQYITLTGNHNSEVQGMTLSEINQMIKTEEVAQKKAKEQKRLEWEKRKTQIANMVGDTKEFFTTKWADVTKKTGLLTGVSKLETAEDKSYFIANFGTAPTKYDPASTKTKKADFVGCCNAYKGYMRNVTKYQSIKNTLGDLAASFADVNAGYYKQYEESLKA